MTPVRDVPTPPSDPILVLADFKPGTIRGTPGFFRVGQTRAGQWWLIDPDNRGFFSRGINAVGRGAWPVPDDLAVKDANPAAELGDLEGVSSLLERLRVWEVNTLGPRSSAELGNCGLADIEVLEFVKVAPQTTIRLGGAHLPDVFDPKWNEACQRQAAERCALRRDDARLIGYLTDDALNWAQPFADNAFSRTERPSLLQICLSLEPGFPAYHAAWEFTLAAHGGEWTSLVRAWDVELPNKETLRQLTLSDVPLTSPGYRRDHELFSREFARRYFSVSASAIRLHDPHHLVFGCTFGASPAGVISAECIAPHVDVLSIAHHDPAFFERIGLAANAPDLPVWLGEFSWQGEAFTAPLLPGEPRGLTSVERMLARGRAALERALSHPALIGCAWARWSDLPGDRPPFGPGLVHIDGSEAREHTELLSDLYARAVRLRHAAARSDLSP